MSPIVGGFAEEAGAAFDPIWLTVEEVVALHERQIARFGGRPGIRDRGGLESALGRARNKWEYESCDLATLAAAHVFGIARNRPFVEGNERAAFVAMMLFLRKNGVPFAPPPAEATRIVIDLAAGSVSEESLARWIRDRRPM